MATTNFDEHDMGLKIGHAVYRQTSPSVTRLEVSTQSHEASSVTNRHYGRKDCCHVDASAARFVLLPHSVRSVR
ncbi:unnamed protein product [Protopolystoma xenopodis]|uniref:Uncharacterized protein n=1 Tax=Protopolystoma xenopodis TaxID=117903 RepID=A0A3S5CDZ9_9PLAT|nr:unnamed protein product [Protopolystoma xenopodis]